MNCQKGDLARIVDHHETRALGVVDAIVKLGGPGFVSSGRIAWVLDPPLIMRNGVAAGHPLEIIADFLVRPIRDQPGEDETLTWAPVPVKHAELLTIEQWEAEHNAEWAGL